MRIWTQKIDKWRFQTSWQLRVNSWIICIEAHIKNRRMNISKSSQCVNREGKCLKRGKYAAGDATQGKTAQTGESWILHLSFLQNPLRPPILFGKKNFPLILPIFFGNWHFPPNPSHFLWKETLSSNSSHFLSREAYIQKVHKHRQRSNFLKIIFKVIDSAPVSKILDHKVPIATQQ